MDGDGAQACQPEGEDEEGDTHEVFAVRQRIFRGIENRRVEEMQRLMRQRVAIPIEDPRIEQRIAEIGDCCRQVRGQRPCQDGGGDEKEREKCELAKCFYSHFASQSATSL